MSDTFEVFLGYRNENIEGGTWQKVTIVYNNVEYFITSQDGYLNIYVDGTLVVFPAASNMIRVKEDDSAPGHKTHISGDIQFIGYADVEGGEDG
jgi:hypothetical protein